MPELIPDIKFPELVFGIVAAIGADIEPTIRALKEYLTAQGYLTIEIKVTDAFCRLSKIIRPNVPLEKNPEQKRFDTYISYGNQLRDEFSDNSVLAMSTVVRILEERNSSSKTDINSEIGKKAFICYQFKTVEEIELLRAVYGSIFFQISIYSSRGTRVDHLSRKFADSNNSADNMQFRSDAEALVQKDSDERDKPSGQRVSKIFHEADFIINSDVLHPSTFKQIRRFCDLLFGSNKISPTKYEYGMFLAKAAALRSLDLSRQVGAAIFTPDGEIVSLGSNEVPKAGGGTYWSGEEFDDREYKRNEDSNERRKIEILVDLIENFDEKFDIQALPKNHPVFRSQFMDALEYGRIIHAEMNAITDAARAGKSIKGSALYSTTFPCHMCAKHIVSSGIEKVVFLEPYPKSLAFDLHSDSIVVEGGDRGKYNSYPAVKFEHFFGVTPRRYIELFSRAKRKDGEGKFLPYLSDEARPIVKLKRPHYFELEQITALAFVNMIKEKSPS